MDLNELIKLCNDKINNPISNGTIPLMIPGRAHGNTKKFPGLGVKGEIVCECDDSCLCAFDARKLLSAIERFTDREADAVN